MSQVTIPPVLDETGQLIKNELYKQNLLLDIIAQSGIEVPTTYEEIHNIVTSGNAEKVFSIGDQIHVPYTATNGTVYDMPWDVVKFGKVTLKSGTEVDGMYIQSHYATVETIQFDAAEPNNTLGEGGTTDEGIASYGYNRWSESGVRAWLNSDATSGNWFGSTFERGGETVTRREADVAPSEVNTYNGFKRGLPSDFLAILKPVKVRTFCNTVTDGGVTDVTHDTFFSPSFEEIYSVPNASDTTHTEGTYFPYWKERLGIATPLPFGEYNEAYGSYGLSSTSSVKSTGLRSIRIDRSRDSSYKRGHGNLTWATSVTSVPCIPCAVIC